METIEKIGIPEHTIIKPAFQPQIKEEKFQPKGAIAFFTLLVILGLVIWYGIYFLMLDRI